MSHADSPLSMPSCMHESTGSVGSAAVVTVRSNEYWIASTRAPCFRAHGLPPCWDCSFRQAARSAGMARAHHIPAGSDEIRYFQLIYVQQISAPTLADIVQLHADDDRAARMPLRDESLRALRCGLQRFQVVRNHADGLFNPGRARPIEFRRCVGPVVATGRTVPVAHSIAKSLDDLSGEQQSRGRNQA